MPYANKARQRAYQREWMRARRAEYLAYKCCDVCDTTDRLEVHHRDPALKIDHKVWSWSEERRERAALRAALRALPLAA